MNNVIANTIEANTVDTFPSEAFPPEAYKPINIKPINVKSSHQEGSIFNLTNLVWRQSLINDVQTCPKMAAYKWVYKFNSLPGNLVDEYGDVSIPLMTSVLGSAGHDVIEEIHRQNKLTFTYTELLVMFENAFWARINEMSDPTTKTINTVNSPDSTKLTTAFKGLLPNVSKGFSSIDEELAAKESEYAEMIQTYQEFHRLSVNAFIPTMQEQMFVFSVKYKDHVYTFSGTMDQVGAYVKDGIYAVRDIKFRDNAYKPNLQMLRLNTQLIIYAAALGYGYPACSDCKPIYYEDQGTITREVRYDGPCDSCRSMIGTPKWPGLFPSKCQLVWMKDFIKLKKANRGRNKGDMKGRGLYSMFIPPSRIENYLQDILEVCHSFRNGIFTRSPGSHCLIFCDSSKQCLKELYIEDNFDSLFNPDVNENDNYENDNLSKIE